MGVKTIKEAKAIMTVSLVAGLLLLAAGLLSRQWDMGWLSGNNALVALSLLPLSLAFASFLKLFRIQKSPHQMRSMLIKENDERLVALNHEADSKTLKVVVGALFLAYFGYTFLFPEEVFESAGWWTLLVLLLGTLSLQSVFRHRLK